MKKILFLVITLYFVNNLFGVEININNKFPDLPIISDEKYKATIQEYLDIFRSTDEEKKEYVRELLVNKGSKEIIPILISNLNDTDMLFKIELEVFLLRLTSKGYYGIAVGNKKGVEEYSNWWAKEGNDFKYPDSLDYYYKEYYKNGKKDDGVWFGFNACTRFWQNIKESKMKFDQKNKLDETTKKAIRYMINIYKARLSKELYGTEYNIDRFTEQYMNEILSFIGKPVIPYKIELIDDGKIGTYVSSELAIMASYSGIPFDGSLLSNKLSKENENKIKKNIELLKSKKTQAKAFNELGIMGPIVAPYVKEASLTIKNANDRKMFLTFIREISGWSKPENEKKYLNNKDFWQGWWDKYEKRVNLTTNGENIDQFKILVPEKQVFSTVLTKELEKKINTNILLMRSEKTSYSGSVELKKIGRLAIPFVIEEFNMAANKDEIFSLNMLMEDILGHIPKGLNLNYVSNKLSKEETYKIWKAWLDEHKDDYLNYKE